MKRPSKKEIKAALEKLHNPTENQQHVDQQQSSQLPDKKSSMRIRKKGV
jgi:hypothetical protein